MSRNKQIIKSVRIGIFVLLIIGLIAKLIFDDRNYYKDVVELNENLKVDNLKLMMSIEEVYNIYGEEESYYENSWWKTYEYPSNGISISVSRPSDYDLHNKVNSLTIRSKEYSVFDIFISIEESKALDILRNKGYKVEEIDAIDKAYKKGCITIYISEKENVVSKIAIHVTDKKFNPTVIDIDGEI